MGTETATRRSLFRIAAEVKAALTAGSPVVALESALITHGLAFPHNLEVAQALEEAVRAAGAVPATVAVVHGEIVVGIGKAEMRTLAETPGTVKVGIRDLTAVAVRGLSGGTTVAATMVVAKRAGIQVFSTGGIGGVHRGSQFDVSADLEALARIQMAVISAGAKAILDLGATLERLETLSVPVIGYRTQDFPGFFSRESGYVVSLRLDTPDSIAEYWQIHCALRQQTGILIANAVPEIHAIPRASIEAWVEDATKEAEDRGIQGQALTPFLLQRMAQLSDGRTIQANKALLINNASLAAEIAIRVAARHRTEEVPL